MSPKAKKYRRDIAPAAARTAPAAAKTAPVAASQSIPAPRAQPKNTAIAVPTAQAFLRELKWIGLTTLIIIILMIAAFYLVPR